MIVHSILWYGHININYYVVATQ
uniref:Uncharacterized protein n=1 Tax=Anguilla anguilla TaxID=7936 RepID=A0A0E9QRN3_ANGAN